jgi:uncharacterized protein (TIGR02145 family)
LNYPPRAVIKAAGGYDLKGTPPFTVNGTTLGDNVTTFGAGTCITSLSDATNNPTSVLPDLPTVSTSNPAARCGAGAVPLTATAGGGTTTAMTYTWVVGGGAAQTTTTGSLSLTSGAVGRTTYSVTVTNANGCTSAAKTGTITVYSNFSAGAITTASGSTTESTDPNVTIANETDASGGDGVITYEWRRSGTSSATFSYSNTTYPISNSTTNYSTPGTYYFTRYAHDGTCNTAWVASSGQYTLTVAATPPPSAGTNTYTCGTQIWSEPVRIAACNKSSFTESTTTPYCRSYTYNSITYYYYNWSYVISYGSTTLCPQPWRVPTADDFQTLMSCLGASPTANIYYPESSTWGGSMGGFTRRDGMHVNGSQAMYRTTTNYNATAAYYFHLNTSHGNVLQTYKVYGMQVRCVR